MKAIQPLDESLKAEQTLYECLKAVGIDSKGERKDFYCNNEILYCSNQDLVSLEIPEGIKNLSCNNNLLKELEIPEGLEDLYCDNNLLTELEIPNSVKLIYCDNNLISELHIPKSMKYLYCDRNVLGLDNVDWDCHIFLY